MEINNKEIEVFGLDYERYALDQTLQNLVKKYGIHNALEIPATGVKAMPSIYSIGIGLAGCRVTLVNGKESSLQVWKKLGIGDLVDIHHCKDIRDTGLKDNEYDFVWNFASFSTLDEKEKVMQEMIRVSKKYISIFSVNSYNPGYISHRMAHYLTKTPWSHGDVSFYSVRKTKKFMRGQGLNIIDTGVLDSPPWPDSIGPRDIRLHRMQIDLSHINWHSRYVDYLSEDRFPLWIKALHMFERIPVPLYIKIFYSHLFFVIAQKKN